MAWSLAELGWPNGPVVSVVVVVVVLKKINKGLTKDPHKDSQKDSQKRHMLTSCFKTHASRMLNNSTANKFKMSPGALRIRRTGCDHVRGHYLRQSHDLP